MSRVAPAKWLSPLLAAGMLLWAAAGFTAPGAPEGSVLPGAGSPPAPAPAERRPEARLEIRTLRAGPAPYVWAENGRTAASFITDTGETVRLVAWADVKGEPHSGREIEWSVVPPDGFQLDPQAVLRGAKLDVRLRRPGGNPTGAGAPLALTVTAGLTRGGMTLHAASSLQQDLRDRLRQEYVDLARAYVPQRAELLDADDFEARFGKSYPTVSFDELNWSRQPGTELRYPVILAAERMVAMLEQTRKEYARPVTVSSGFRNPVRQLEVHAAVEESRHQYGRAADLYVAPDSAPPKTGRSIATESDWLALAAAALRGGGVWIEPMLDCHVNTAGCHVHVDMRESGASSRLVRVRGRVTDPAGYAVPGATVRLAGMPAVTNAQGEFLLKHVVTPEEIIAEVEAPRRTVVTQAVKIPGDEATVALQVPSDPDPALIARSDGPVIRLTGAQRTVQLRVAVKNVGLTPGSNVRFEALELPPSTVLVGVEPARLPVLSPGQEAAITVTLGLPSLEYGPVRDPSDLTVALSARLDAPAGESRVQQLQVEARAPQALALTPPAPVRHVAEQPAKTILPPAAPGSPDLIPAAAGLAVGGVAGVITAISRRRRRDKAEEAIEPEDAPDPS